MVTKTEDLKEGSLRIVIPSRKRVKLLRTNALKLFPYATVTVGESEAVDYAPLFRDGVANLVLHPDEVTGTGPIHQWILENFNDEALFVVDDDVYKLVVLTGYRQMNITSAANAYAIILNAANIAKAMGAPVFGFNQAWDVRKFRPQDPFRLNTRTGGGVGVIGRDIRHDTALLSRDNVDFCLNALLKRRYVFVDNRFSFVHRRYGVTGGNALHRSKERNTMELEYLKRKWGQYIFIQQTKTTTRLVIRVRRRQGSIRLADDVGEATVQ